MKYAEINKAFTEAVATKIAQGYTICTNTMSGTQGEIAITKESRKTIASLYKRYKYRGQVAIAQKNILSAYVTRLGNGKRELCIVPVAGKGSPVRVSFNYARG